MIRRAFWRALAWVLARPPIANWLIRRSRRTPYSPIMSADLADTYMERHWLFNPYWSVPGLRRWGEWLPSVRLHHIRREDQDRHLHDHPWNARSIVLRGYYLEQNEGVWHYTNRRAGRSSLLRFGQFHKIAYVPPGGVFTLFITYRYRGTWGFQVDGQKVPHRTYLEGGA